MDGPKENANPTILSLDEDSSSLKRQKALRIPEIAAISSGDLAFSASAAVKGARSMTDRAVLQALVDASAASKGKNVALLRNIGMDIPENQSEIASVYREPLFVPTTKPLVAVDTDSSNSGQTESSPPTTTKDPIDADEIYEIIRNVQDPEHPLTLEQLGVVSRQQITITNTTIADDEKHLRKKVDVRYTPTIPHCSMATLIGLCLRVKLFRSLTAASQDASFQVTVRIEPGTHQSELSVNKQLADKERVCAALENKHLAGVVNRCIGNGMTGNMSAAV